MVLPSSNLVSDSNVIKDDLAMGMCLLTAEELLNIVCIGKEFLFVMREYKRNRTSGVPERRRPIRACLNLPFCFSHTKDDFRFSNASFSLFIKRDIMERGEDEVEVDGLSFDNFLPLGGRYSFGESNSTTEESFGTSEIISKSLEDFAGLLAARSS